MKTRLLKKGRVLLPILLALVLATGGLVGLASGADGAAKGKTYEVTVSGSTTGMTSQDKGPALEIGGELSGNFQIMVDSKGQKFVIPRTRSNWIRSLRGLLMAILQR